MAITGYDTVGDKRFPRFAGPCKRCGAVNYGLSTSGPDYCGACAIGRPVEEIKLRRDLEDVMEKYFDALLALQMLTGFKWPPPTKKMEWRAEEFVRRFKADADLRIGAGPDIKE